ncbi:MAG: AsmA-like C-terminal region-containing protein [Bacteroidota bacterium]
MKKVIKVTVLITFVCIALFSSVLIIGVFQQDRIVRNLVESINGGFSGRLVIDGSHISPFVTFPYISIDLEDISLYESKEADSERLLYVSDGYLGFDFWSILNGSFEVKSIKLDSGFLKLVQHKDGTFNIVNALSDTKDVGSNDKTSEFSLNLKSLQLTNIDLLKLNEETNVLVEAFIENSQSSLNKSRENTYVSLDSRFIFNLVIDGDTSFLHHKHVDLHTELDFDATQNILEISPSEVVIEKAIFLMDGAIDVDNDMDLKLKFSGNKPDFDLFLSLVPEEFAPALKRYENGGRIYFDASVEGKSINGYNPAIKIDFGCAEAFVSNTLVDKEVSDLFFKGHFTNGEKRDPTTMMFSIQDFSARPEAGIFKGDVSITNFEAPEIDVQLNSEFDLDFLTGFLNIDNLRDVTGKVSLTMNFHDIIDLDNPERSIEKLNEAYFAELKVEGLNFNSTGYDLPVRDINIDATMDGSTAKINRFDMKLGKSDLSMKASLSDVPAILHHTNIPVEAILEIQSSLIDFNELTSVNADSINPKVYNEQVKDLSMGLKFKASAQAFTESRNLPVGEFFIERLNATLTNYPHRLHDFNADVYVNDDNFRVIDFTGMIDDSDFHFNGQLDNYDLWFQKDPVGHTRIDFHLISDLLQLDDVFAYGGENYVPKDYRHEEFRNLKIDGVADLSFNRKLGSSNVRIDNVAATMKVHPMRFENFSGNIYMDSLILKVDSLGGKLGRSEFKANFLHHRKKSGAEKKHSFELISPRLDFDELFAYNPPPVTDTVDHTAAFNIFEVPFSDMDFSVSIENLNYHRYELRDFVLEGRMQKDHFLYVDDMSTKVAGGEMKIKGYFNGSDPENIYFNPEIEVSNLNLDQILFKFENFGQDHLVSENLNGRVSGTLAGKVRVHADLIPIIDDSDIQTEFKVVNGSLVDYSAFDALSSYFADKNLNNVRFDTLRNVLNLKNGTLDIPTMNINSSLGYFELSGTQDVNLNMEYYLRVPWKVVTRAGAQKLFGKKDRDTSEQVDDIQVRDESKRTRFLNLKIEGTPEDYKISLGRDKD